MKLILQAIKSLLRKIENRFAKIESELTDESALGAVIEMGLVSPVAAEDGSLYVDKNGVVYSL